MRRHGAAVDDRAGWRAASPWWEPQRERHIARQLEAAKAGEIVDEALEEPDPSGVVSGAVAEPVAAYGQPSSRGSSRSCCRKGCGRSLVVPGLHTQGPVIVALEDDFGKGAAVGCVSRLDDGRLEVDGWRTDDWDTAIAEVERLAKVRWVRELHVGASLMDRIPKAWGLRARPVGMTEAKAGLAVFRDLAAAGMLAHDDTTAELDQALAHTQVRESPSGLGGRARPEASGQGGRVGCRGDA